MPEIGDSAKAKEIGKKGGGTYFYRRCPDCDRTAWSRQTTKLQSTTLQTCASCTRTPPSVFRKSPHR